MGKASRLKKEKKKNPTIEEKLTQEQLNELLENLKKAEVDVQKQEKCYHKTITKLKDDSMWYQCTECKQIILFMMGAMYNSQLLSTEMEEVLKNVK